MGTWQNQHMNDGHEAFELSRKLYQAPVLPAPIVVLPNWPETVVTVCSDGAGVWRRNVLTVYRKDWT